MNWDKVRSTPYTARGIKRLKCARCGGPGFAQWNICSDGSYRVICQPCDVELNRLVLDWVGHPRAQELGDKYEAGL